MKSVKFVHFLLPMILVLAGCATVPPAAQEQPTIESTLTFTPLPSDTPTPTIDAPATQCARQTEDALAAKAAAAAATATKDAERNNSVHATQTAQLAVKRTSTAVVRETQAAEEAAFQAVLLNLQNDGVITNTDGQVFNIPDGEWEEARIDYLIYRPIDFSAESFVLQTNLSWSSASMTANWFNSGCGFVFGLDKPKVYDFAYLALDGNVQVARHSLSGDWKPLMMKKWEKPELPSGSAKFMMVVFDKRFTFYVNDKLVGSTYDAAYKPGTLHYTVVSGTNKSFGTRCSFSDGKLFIFK